MSVVMENVPARDRRRIFSRSEGKRTNSGKLIADVRLGQTAAREEPYKALEKIIDLLRAGLRIVGVVGSGHFAGADKELAVPGNHKDGSPVDRFRIDGLPGRAGKFRQHQMR